jgi:hypothetical protein
VREYAGLEEEELKEGEIINSEDMGSSERGTDTMIRRATST